MTIHEPEATLRTRGTGAALALAGALVAVPASSSPAVLAPPACEGLAFSPEFTRDRTMFCLTIGNGLASLHRSGDGGQSWGRRQVVDSDGAKSGSMVVSPLFARDRRVWVSTAHGLYRSDDAGDTFTNVSGEGAPSANLMTPYVETVSASPGAQPHAAFAVTRSSVFGATVYDSELGFRSVVGAPTFNTRFIVPPDYATTRQAVVIASNVGIYREDKPVVPDTVGYSAYLCVGDFTCPHRIAYFANVSSIFGALGPTGGYYFGGTESTNYHFSPEPSRRPHSTFRTRDRGRTWQRWPSVDKLLDREDVLNYSIAASPDAPRRLFLHTTAYSERTKTKRPGTQLFRSDDDGATWRRIGFAWEPGQRPTARATLPWNVVQVNGYAESSVFARGGRLYVLGEHRTGKTTHFRGMYCSADLGRTWRRGTCPPGGTTPRLAARP